MGLVLVLVGTLALGGCLLGLLGVLLRLGGRLLGVLRRPLGLVLLRLGLGLLRLRRAGGLGLLGLLATGVPLGPLSLGLGALLVAGLSLRGLDLLSLLSLLAPSVPLGPLSLSLGSLLVAGLSLLIARRAGGLRLLGLLASGLALNALSLSLGALLVVGLSLLGLSLLGLSLLNLLASGVPLSPLRIGLDTLLVTRLDLLLALRIVAGARLELGLTALGLELDALLAAGVAERPGLRLALQPLLVAALGLSGLLRPARSLGLATLVAGGELAARDFRLLTLGVLRALGVALGAGLVLGLDLLLARLAIEPAARLGLRARALWGGGGRDDRRQARRVGLALRAFLVEGDLSLLRPRLGAALVAPATPVVVALLLGRPLALRRQDHVAVLAPVGSVGGLPLLVQRGVVQAPGAIEVARRIVDLRRAIVRVGPAIAVVDLDQFAVVVGVGIVGVADQEGIVAVSPVEVLPDAIGRLLDHAVFAASGTPYPGALALIVDGVVGWAVGEGVTQLVGGVDIAVDRARPRGAAKRWGRRELVGGGRHDLGGRRGLRQGQACDRRAGDGSSRFLVARGERQARGGGGQEKAAVGHGAQTLRQASLFQSGRRTWLAGHERPRNRRFRP